MRKDRGFGANPQESILKAAPFSLAINVANDFFCTSIVVEKHEKLAALENKKKLRAVNIVSKVFNWN